MPDSSEMVSSDNRYLFLYDGDQIVCGFNSNGDLSRINVWGAHGLIGRQSGTNAGTPIYDYLWDNKGNISASVSPYGGVDTTYRVTAWGEVTSDGGSYDPYRCMGGELGNYFDQETGLVLCGQRYYDPSGGRWINRDPISYAGGLNVYGYVGNNPVNSTDPSGLARVELRWRRVFGPGNHSFLLIWDTDAKGNKIGAPRYFAGYQGSGSGWGDKLTTRNGYYTAPKGYKGCPDYHYTPGHPDYRGSLLIANDNKPASAYINRFKAVAARINRLNLPYPTGGIGPNSNSVVRTYLQIGLGIDVSNRLPLDSFNNHRGLVGWDVLLLPVPHNNIEGHDESLGPYNR